MAFAKERREISLKWKQFRPTGPRFCRLRDEAFAVPTRQAFHGAGLIRREDLSKAKSRNDSHNSRSAAGDSPSSGVLRGWIAR
jgi:hypothetical protein